jgi:threonine dehydrogenase-like Zn-dependent dehydrogenase
MVTHPGKDSYSKEDAAIFILYLLSFILGVLVTLVANRLPVGEITLINVIIAVASALGIASVIGWAFLFLTRVFVINPIREELEDATVKYDGDEMTYQSSDSGDDAEIASEILNQMGYQNTGVADPDSDSPMTTEEDDDDESD